jgi:hypothetical protein
MTATKAKLRIWDVIELQDLIDRLALERKERDG